MDFENLMPKINPDQLRRGAKATFQVELSDPESGVSDTITLRHLSAAEMLAFRDDAEQMIESYITQGEPVGSVGGEPVYVGQQTCHIAAGVAFAQVGQADRYTPVELVMLMASDNICAQIVEAYAKLMKGQEKTGQDDDQGNLGKTTAEPSHDAA